ncbi:hypothetical protein Tco_1486895, partial [Tanacetum coccineum]
MPNLEDDSDVFPNDGIFSGAFDDEDVGAEADFNNMDNTIDVSPIPTLRVHRDHPKDLALAFPTEGSSSEIAIKALILVVPSSFEDTDSSSQSNNTAINPFSLFPLSLSPFSLFPFLPVLWEDVWLTGGEYDLILLNELFEDGVDVLFEGQSGV